MGVEVREVTHSKPFRVTCGVLGAFALIWLGILLLGGSSSTNPPVDSFGSPVVPAYAADIVELPPTNVSFDFINDPDHGWLVGIAPSVPDQRMTHTEFINAPRRYPTGYDKDGDGEDDGPGDDVVIARSVTCRYAVPAGSRYLPELSANTELSRMSSGEANEADVWVDRDCHQFGFDSSPDAEGFRRGGGSMGLQMRFALPDSVLRSGGQDESSLVFQLRDHVDALTGRQTRAWFDAGYPVDYAVHPGSWSMQAFVPSADEVTVNNPSALEATSSRTENGVTRLTGDSVHVALTDPTGRQRTAFLIAILSFVLPFLAQGAFRHLFRDPSSQPSQTSAERAAQAARSGNPAVQKRAVQQAARTGKRRANK